MIDNGAGIYDANTQGPSTTNFMTTYSGCKAVRVFGSNDFVNPDITLLQTFPAPTAGSTFVLSGKAFVSSIDPFTENNSESHLILKAFDSNWNMIDSATSTSIDINTTQDLWIDVEASLVVPEDIMYIQAALEFKQVALGGGSVYFDFLNLSVP